MVVSSYTSLISVENIFQAWQEFKKGKREKRDVQVFDRHLEDNIFDLHQKLADKTYKHGSYQEFYVNDPKRRHIHKANIKDRIVHHLLYKYLYEIFDKTFIFDSYSCRIEKGTHKAVKRLEKFARIVSKNYTQECRVLKLDVKKFFDSIDHNILKRLIAQKVKEKNILWLLKEVIESFSTENNQRQLSLRGAKRRGNLSLGLDRRASLAMTGLNKKGIPLGNLTSQIFANIYLNELDQFVKHKLKVKYYIRYADDFLLLDKNCAYLYQCINTLKRFLSDELKLELHPQKIFLRKLPQGIDFCGYIILPHYRLIRTKTKRRILKKVLNQRITNQSLQSYLGYFSHANSFKLRGHLKNLFYLTQSSQI